MARLLSTYPSWSTHTSLLCMSLVDDWRLGGTVLRGEVLGGVNTSLEAWQSQWAGNGLCCVSLCLQYGVDGVLELIGVSVGCMAWLDIRTNSLTTLEEPFRANLCTLEESLLED